MTVRLFAEEGGQGAPALVLLHGLGAAATVWDGMKPLVAAHWPGRWIAPDLRGHGRSPHAEPYGYATLAADVAGLLRQDEEVAILGHSMGGAVAMALATGWFGLRVRAVMTLGVKLVWSADELARTAELARAPARLFDEKGQAVDRYLRVAGLAGLVDPASAAARVGVSADGEKFRLAYDPRANGVADSPVESVIKAVRAPLRLAAGEKDPMATYEQMQPYDPGAVVLSGLGHNAHVEAPERVWTVFNDFVRENGLLAQAAGAPQ